MQFLLIYQPGFQISTGYIKSRKEIKCCIEIIFYYYYTLRDNTSGNLLLLSWDDSVLSEHVDGYQHGFFTVCKNI